MSDSKRLGGEEKVRVKLVGTDGNVFALLGKCRAALRAAGQLERARELSERVMEAGSYSEALALMCEYCDVR